MLLFLVGVKSMKEKDQVKAFWGRVDEVMRGRGMKLTNLSNKSGIGYRKILMQRHRDCFPSVPDTYTIARVLGVSVDYLVEGEQPGNLGNVKDFRKYADIEDDLLAIETSCPDRIELVRHFIDSILGRSKVKTFEMEKVIDFPGPRN
jgi:hypothetical protein